MIMARWDDEQYLKFADERTRAAVELLARVPTASAREVVDLGCGPGNSTALLAARWPDAHITGVDNSPDMLERARKDLPAHDWVEADVAAWRANVPPDVLFANAVLQWLPDHEQLIPRLFAQLAPGAVLAVQMPYNQQEPSHRLMREVPEPFAPHVQNARALSRVSSPAFYYDLLAPHAAHVDVWRTTYEHVMADPSAIVEWVKGTGLRPYLEALPDALRVEYLAHYKRGIDQAYPRRSDGKRLFSFPRLFIVAVKRGGDA
jgi:trans-aconitate 2-methyltransferase